MMTWNLKHLPVAGIGVSIIGGGIESPRSLSNEGGVIDVSGGGYWKFEMRRVQMHGGDATGHALWMRYRSILDGGAGKIVVPMINDIVAPGMVIGSGFSGGATFSDGGVFRSARAVASFENDAALAAGAVTIRLSAVSTATPTPPNIFSVYHRRKGWRAYQIDKVTTRTSYGDAGVVMGLTIRPTLREAVVAGTSVDFGRPRCTMRLPAGASMPWEPEGYWRATPSITFIEAMR